MGIFDRFRIAAAVEHQRPDLSGRRSREDAERRSSSTCASQLAKAKQQVATAIADEKRLRDQADAEFKQARRLGERRRCSRSRKAATISPSRRSCARASTTSHGQQLAQTWETHRLETEKLKNSLRDLNDKIEEAKRKKNLLIARQRRAAGAEAHRRDDVVDVGEVGVRRVRADGRAHRDERAPAQGVDRDRRGVHRRPARAGLQAAREGRGRRQRRRAAARAQAEDGHAPCRISAAEESARRRAAGRRRRSTPRSRTSRARRRAIEH